ncbi:MAG: KH domain-containing protein, partial [Clostridia bacterium]|nr:KH domain-containing protein [Clostridia bacterium]
TKLSDNLTEIHANIYCERASHKSIIIGKQGSMLHDIGSQARADIERMMGTKVMLKLWVKVREDWGNRESDLRATGYEE